MLLVIFFAGVRIGAKQEYYRESSFNAFKIMRDLEALRTNQTESNEITALIQEKETDLDAELITVSTYQQNGLIWLNFLLAKSNDTAFLRSIADYRNRHPSHPMVTKNLTKEQQKGYLRFYAEMLREQNLLLEKYR
ncbi:MAG: hypothetical protein ACXW1T_05930 [Methylophilus sp.]